MDALTFAPDIAPAASAQPPKMNKRETAKAATRAKVIASAANLFAAEGGYVQATIRDIAKGAGMSTGAVFANFTDKRDLYIAIEHHAPVTIEQGKRLFMLMRDLLPELESEIDDRRSGGRHDAWLADITRQATAIVREIEATGVKKDADA